MILHNATAFVDGRFQAHTDVRVAGGRVTELCCDRAITDDGEYTMDLAGDYLLPGFVDVHIHAYKGRDTMEGEAAVRHMSRELYKGGVAGFLPTTMSADVPDTLAALKGIRAVMAQPEAIGARVLGAHMEAPFLQPSKCGAQRKECFLQPTMANFEKITGDNGDIVRIITLAPELEGAMEVIRELTGRGITVSLGHTSADAATVHQAAEMGASHVTHTFNAQTPLLHREPGVPGASLVDDRLYNEMICDGIHLHPDILKLIFRCKGKRTVAITDAMEAAGMPDGEYALGGQQVFVKAGAARLASGVLAGSTLTMANALRNLISFGFDPADAAYITTAAPADSIGEKTVGRLQVGCPAPLTRWSRDWQRMEVL